MENGNADNDRDKVEKDRSRKKNARISDIRQGGGQDQVKEEVMETTFQRTRLIKRGPGANNEDTNSSDSEIPYVEWKIMQQQIKNKNEAGTSTSAGSICKTVVSATAACSKMAVDKKEIPKLVSFWDLVGLEGSDRPKTMLKLEAQTEMVSPKTTENCVDESKKLTIVDVDLTADSPEEDDHELSVV